MAPKLTEAEMQALYNRAVYEGQKAAQAVKPTPMVVTHRVNPLDHTSPIVFQDIVNDGVCGFAWVVVRPGNSSFARWLKKNNLAHTHYGGGVSISIRDYNQSLERKEAHARAMRDVLRAAGIECYMDSRLD